MNYFKIFKILGGVIIGLFAGNVYGSEEALLNTARTQCESGITAIPQDKKTHKCATKAATAKKKAEEATDATRKKDKYLDCNIHLEDLRGGKDCNSDKKRKAPTDWSTDPQACGTSKDGKFTFDLTGVQDDETCTIKQDGKWKRPRTIGAERHRRNSLPQ